MEESKLVIVEKFKEKMTKDICIECHEEKECFKYISYTHRARFHGCKDCDEIIVEKYKTNDVYVVE